MSQSLRGSTVTNYFKFSLAGTSTIVLYSFESPWASLCPCANTCCVRGVAWARPRRASKRLDCRLWKRDLFHQHNRKGKIVMIETSRYKGLVFGFVFGTWNWYDFWRRSWGLPCNALRAFRARQSTEKRDFVRRKNLTDCFGNYFDVPAVSDWGEKQTVPWIRWCLWLAAFDAHSNTEGRPGSCVAWQKHRNKYGRQKFIRC